MIATAPDDIKFMAADIVRRLVAGSRLIHN